MMDLHILSAPVITFWKCHKKALQIFVVVEIFDHISIGILFFNID